jgi:hypothetical protein
MKVLHFVWIIAPISWYARAYLVKYIHVNKGLVILNAVHPVISTNAIHQIVFAVAGKLYAI